MNTQTILTAARVACFREIPDYYNTKNLAIGPWFLYRNAQGVNTYNDHPRADDTPLRPMCNWSKMRPNYWTTELAYDYTGLQPAPCDVADMMTYFANHVRDALKFDY